MNKIRAINAEAAKRAAQNYTIADYGYEYCPKGIRWYVLIYMV